MKIAFIRARYNPFGGAERFLNSAAEALVAQGSSPTIITRAWPDSGHAGIQQIWDIEHRQPALFHQGRPRPQLCRGDAGSTAARTVRPGTIV